MPNLPKPSRRNYQPPKVRRPTGDQAFLSSTAWRAASKLQRQLHPLCEVSEAIGVIESADVTDHIIAREFGGSLFDKSNLMSMCSYYHNKKSGMEAHGLFLRTKRGPDGMLIPADRKQVIEVLTKGPGGTFKQNQQ